MSETALSPLVFITGASSGIGQALALRYYQAGWRLALLARRGESIKQWAIACGVSDSSYQIYIADVADSSQVLTAAQACLAQQGVPDVVIANAGISLGVDTSRQEDIAVMARVLAVNNVGMAASFQPFINPMRQRGSGCLVGIASVAGIRGLPGHGAYCASKAGVIAYCESLRGELAAENIAVVTLLPGYIDTPLTQKNRYNMPFLMSAEAFAEKAFQCITRRHRYAVIPWQMSWVARIMKYIPVPLWDRLLVGRPRKHRHNEP